MNLNWQYLLTRLLMSFTFLTLIFYYMYRGTKLDGNIYALVITNGFIATLLSINFKHFVINHLQKNFNVNKSNAEKLMHLLNIILHFVPILFFPTNSTNFHHTCLILVLLLVFYHIYPFEYVYPMFKMNFTDLMYYYMSIYIVVAAFLANSNYSKS